ncbi:MAG: hypothetical protein ICV81_18830 [Flavisolibacter sp.]|nr:hypothetical protein [Flavisolibacter sp.]
MTNALPNPQDGAMKANEFAIDALKQIITLASAILALTITFIKDALGESRHEAILTFLLPVCWGLLIISIWFSWVALVEAANTLAKQGTALYVFDQDVIRKVSLEEQVKKAIKKCLTYARIAQVSFVAGLAALALFALVNWKLFFKPSSALSKEDKVQKAQSASSNPDSIFIKVLVIRTLDSGFKNGIDTIRKYNNRFGGAHNQSQEESPNPNKKDSLEKEGTILR